MAETTDTWLNNAYIFFCGVLVLLMHVGFAMLEAGAVQPKNRSSILLKNVFALATAGICWYIFGYQIATGANPEAHSGFLGVNSSTDTYIAIADLPITGTNFIGWFFGFAFAATAATIVSGAVAERVSFKGFLVFTAILTAWIYPVVSYWCWSAQGWLKLAGQYNSYWSKWGYLDFAGSGVVHLTGAVAALVASYMMGPRKYMGPVLNPDGTKQEDGLGQLVYIPRFEEDGTVNDPPQGNTNKTFATLGTLILWVGWYGFNCGSQLAIASTSDAKYVGLAVVNTTLSPCAAVVSYAVLSMATAYVDLNGTLNVALTGLVSITANCNYVMPWAAVCIGLVAGPVYIGASYALKRFQIDDVVDAIPVHGAGGIWGVFVTGLIVDPRLCAPHDAGILYNGDGTMFGWQLIGILCIIAWVGTWSFLALGALHYVPPIFGHPSWLRVNKEEEQLGFDEMIRRANIEAIHTPDAPKPRGEDPDVELTDTNPTDKPWFTTEQT